MEKAFYEDETRTGIDFTSKPFPIGAYDNCIFKHFQFSNQDLSSAQFLECQFIDCDLSTVKIVDTAFRNVHFSGCKLMGMHFDTSNSFLFEVSFENCQLNFSSFYQRQLKSSKFVSCSLTEVDFTEAQLTKAIFDQCDLTRAVFENTNLEGADLSSSFNFIINPEMNNISKAQFSLNGLPGLLEKYRLKII